MSQENVEIVRRIYQASTRRDAESLFALYDSEVEWDVTRSQMARLVGGSVYFGHDGLRDFFRTYHDAWETVEYEAEALIDHGDQVISVDIERARGRASGVATEMTQYAVWTIRDGRVIRVAWFSNREDALEAVGLAE
jgi:ketosteroid isomerase-like protein